MHSLSIDHQFGSEEYWAVARELTTTGQVVLRNVAVALMNHCANVAYQKDIFSDSGRFAVELKRLMLSTGGVFQVLSLPSNMSDRDRIKMHQSHHKKLKEIAKTTGAPCFLLDEANITDDPERIRFIRSMDYKNAHAHDMFKKFRKYYKWNTIQ